MPTLETWGPPVLEDGYRAAACTATGPARSARFAPVGYSLWQTEAELAAGTELSWDAHHGDEALFVLAGELDHTGRRLAAGSVVAVETGVEAGVRAVTDVHLLHFGPHDTQPPAGGRLGPPSQADRGVHTFTWDEAATVLPEPFEVGPRYFLDGTCPTCRLALFSVDGRRLDAPYRVRSHIHDQDEIVRVLEGELHMGPVTVGEGMSVAVPARHRYGFRTTGAFRFVNYRADVTTITLAPGSEPVLETIESIRAFVA